MRVRFPPRLVRVALGAARGDVGFRSDASPSQLASRIGTKVRAGSWRCRWVWSSSPVPATSGVFMPIQLVNTSGLADVAHGLMIAALIILFLYLAGSIVE